MAVIIEIENACAAHDGITGRVSRQEAVTALRQQSVLPDDGCYSASPHS